MRRAYSENPHDSEVILTWGVVGCETVLFGGPLKAPEIRNLLVTALKLDPETIGRIS